MKYFATINEQSYEIDIDHHGRIRIDGADMDADMRKLSSDLYSLLVNGVSHEVVLDSESESRGLYGIMVGGLRFTVRVQDERSRRLALVDRSLRAPEGELAIKAPIPGLVVKVAVEPGMEVAEGDPLIILEAMKMENELRAPRTGTIHDVRVVSGDQVALNQVLLSLR